MTHLDRRSLLLGTLGLIAASQGISAAAAATDPLETMATSPTTIWNGVTITPQGRIFVALPNWLGPSAGAGEIGKDGVLKPWPGNDWNRWSPEGDATKSLVSVNAIRLNPKGDELWVVDAGAPLGGQRLPGASKIVVFDVATGDLKKVYPLNDVLQDPKAAPNDIRFHGEHAYLSESGVGSILVLNIPTGNIRRLLTLNPLLVMDPNKPVMIDGAVLKNASGKTFGTNANQLEVSPDGRWFYIQPLNGGMTRIETRFLNDPAVTAEELTRELKPFADTPALSGSAIDADGNLYLNAIADRSILRLSPDGKMETILKDQRLRWADAPWLTDDGYLWLPVAQLGWTPMLNGGTSKLEWPAPLYRFKVRGA